MKQTNLRHEKIKQKLTLGVMLATYVPFLLFANLPDWGDTDAVIRWLGSQTGYAAAVMFMWQFVLGTRSVAGLVHKDLVWTMNLHKKIGIYGIFLVFLHPFLIAYTYSEDFLYLFAGSLETDFDRHVGFGRMAFLLFLFTWLTSAILRAKIGYRPWKYIHYSTYLIFPLVLMHAPGVGSFYAGDRAFRIAWQVMIAVFVIMLALRLRHFFTYGQYPYKLIKKQIVADNVFLYQLKPLKKKLKPSPGQFMYTRRGFWSEEHPFSVAGYNEKTGQINIASKVFGKYTKKLSELEAGSIIYLDGPYGVFTQEVEVDTTRPVTFIAGGIGITPFIQHVLNNKRQDITLFSANRGKQNVVVQSLMKDTLGERYVDVFSDEDHPGAEKGRISAEMLQRHLGDRLDDQQYYICGPPPMMHGVQKMLREQGVPKKQIHIEDFGF